MLRNIKVFESVSVEDELPPFRKNIIAIATDKLSRVSDLQLREAMYDSEYNDDSKPYFSIGKRASDDLYSEDKVTHWLKPKEIYCAFETKEEFDKYLYKLLGAEYIKELH